MLTPPPVTQTILPTLTAVSDSSLLGTLTAVSGSSLLGAPPSGLEGGSSLALSLLHVAAGLSRRLRLVP